MNGLKFGQQEKPWVITQAGTPSFAISAGVVSEMVILPETCAVPGVPDQIRGVMNLRGKVIPLIDLRKRLGMSSSQQEVDQLCALMEQRAQDHRRWLEELLASVRERRKFTLATDPHKCAFGKWYDSFQTDDIVLSPFLKKFDSPHKRIHALAVQVEEWSEQGRSQAAIELIEGARDTVLAHMLQLFRDFPVLLRESRREVAVVCKGTSGVCALCVDSVTSVEKLPAEGIERLEGKEFEQQGRMVSSVAKRSKGEGLVLILDLDAVMDSVKGAALPTAPTN